VSELTHDELEAIAEEIRPSKFPVEQSARESKVRIGRPPRLRRRDEWQLYCYRKSGVSIKTCASMFRVSVPTANRIIAKFREYDARVEPIAREFRDMVESGGETTLS
jgi:hypothetical protein